MLGVLNGIHEAALTGLIAWPEAALAAGKLTSLPTAVISVTELGVQETWERFVARRGGRVSLSDAIYLKLAERIGCELWTVDDHLVRTIGEQFPWVQSLSDFVPEKAQRLLSPPPPAATPARMSPPVR